MLHTICAFANDFHNLGGGYIVVGVGEKSGQPVYPEALEVSDLEVGELADAVTGQVQRLSRSSKQKYRLTEKGRTVVVSLNP